MSVDLWSEDASKEVSLVRHTIPTTPSAISTNPEFCAQAMASTPGFTNILPSGYPYGQIGYDNMPLYIPQQSHRPSGSGGSGPMHGMVTRNLLGSMGASAFDLYDTNNKIGVWFVLHDLSIRTEGFFRLRFSLVDVGVRPTPESANSGPVLNTGQIPILASVFSDVFQVFSPKKYPGVCESTPLSKCFAAQGVKIPIRKEGLSSKVNRDDDDY